MEGLLGDPAGPGSPQLGGDEFDTKTHTFSELFHNCVYMGTVAIFLYFAYLNNVFLAKRKRLIGEFMFGANVCVSCWPIHPHPNHGWTYSPVRACVMCVLLRGGAVDCMPRADSISHLIRSPGRPVSPTPPLPPVPQRWRRRIFSMPPWSSCGQTARSQ